jgi:hypothetical protein
MSANDSTAVPANGTQTGLVNDTKKADLANNKMLLNNFEVELKNGSAPTNATSKVISNDTDKVTSNNTAEMSANNTNPKQSNNRAGKPSINATADTANETSEMTNINASGKDYADVPDNENTAVPVNKNTSVPVHENITVPANENTAVPVNENTTVPAVAAETGPKVNSSNGAAGRQRGKGKSGAAVVAVKSGNRALVEEGKLFSKMSPELLASLDRKVVASALDKFSKINLDELQ